MEVREIKKYSGLDTHIEGLYENNDNGVHQIYENCKEEWYFEGVFGDELPSAKYDRADRNRRKNLSWDREPDVWEV